jgi:hypothetical protein
VAGAIRAAGLGCDASERRRVAAWALRAAGSGRSGMLGEFATIRVRPPLPGELDVRAAGGGHSREHLADTLGR